MLNAEQKMRIKTGYIKRENDSDNGRRNKETNRLGRGILLALRAVQMSRRLEGKLWDAGPLLTAPSDVLPGACTESTGQATWQQPRFFGTQSSPGAQGPWAYVTTYRAGGWAEVGRMGKRAEGLIGWHRHLLQNGCNRSLPVCCTAPAAFAFQHRHWYSPRGLAKMPVAKGKEADLNHHVLCGYSD